MTSRVVYVREAALLTLKQAGQVSQLASLLLESGALGRVLMLFHGEEDASVIAAGCQFLEEVSLALLHIIVCMEKNTCLYIKCQYPTRHGVFCLPVTEKPNQLPVGEATVLVEMNLYDARWTSHYSNGLTLTNVRFHVFKTFRVSDSRNLCFKAPTALLIATWALYIAKPCLIGDHWSPMILFLLC